MARVGCLRIGDLQYLHDGCSFSSSLSHQIVLVRHSSTGLQLLFTGHVHGNGNAVKFPWSLSHGEGDEIEKFENPVGQLQWKFYQSTLARNAHFNNIVIQALLITQAALLERITGYHSRRTLTSFLVFFLLHSFIIYPRSQTMKLNSKITERQFIEISQHDYINY